MTKDKMLEILKEVRDFFTKNPDWWPTNDLGIMTAKILDADHAIRSAEPTALDLIAQEREKQISKGYTVEHDQKYVQRTGISYSLLADRLLYNGDLPDDWNMDYWIKLRNLPIKRKLAIAGAWIAAELERIIHLENKES